MGWGQGIQQKQQNRDNNSRAVLPSHAEEAVACVGDSWMVGIVGRPTGSAQGSMKLDWIKRKALSIIESNNPPQVLVINGGLNGTKQPYGYRSSSTESVVQYFREIAQAAQAKGIKVVIVGIDERCILGEGSNRFSVNKDNKATKINNELAKIAAEYGGAFVNPTDVVSRDQVTGFHLTQKGYGDLAKEITLKANALKTGTNKSNATTFVDSQSTNTTGARNEDAIGAITSAGSNSRIITGAGSTNEVIWKAFSAVMGTEDIKEYQRRSKYLSFTLKDDGKIGAMTTTSILAGAIEILKDSTNPKYAAVKDAFNKIYGRVKDDAELIAKIDETKTSIKNAAAKTWNYYMQVGLDLISGSLEDRNNFAVAMGKKSWDEYAEYIEEEAEYFTNFDYSSLSTDKAFNALVKAIIGQESGGSNTVANKRTACVGIGQVHPDNVARWTKEILGESMSYEQFRYNREAQWKVVTAKLGQMYKREYEKTGGNLELTIRRVASEWYSGNPNWLNSTKDQPGSEPTIKQYTLSVLGRVQRIVAA